MIDNLLTRLYVNKCFALDTMNLTRNFLEELQNWAILKFFLDRKIARFGEFDLFNTTCKLLTSGDAYALGSCVPWIHYPQWNVKNYGFGVSDLHRSN